ncbi:hypothetical protein Droror1_Dr00021211 [Drosera rotundifolia]
MLGSTPLKDARVVMVVWSSILGVDFVVNDSKSGFVVHGAADSGGLRRLEILLLRGVGSCCALLLPNSFPKSNLRDRRAMLLRGALHLDCPRFEGLLIVVNWLTWSLGFEAGFVVEFVRIGCLDECVVGELFPEVWWPGSMTTSVELGVDELGVGWLKRNGADWVNRRLSMYVCGL